MSGLYFLAALPADRQADQYSQRPVDFAVGAGRAPRQLTRCRRLIRLADRQRQDVAEQLSREGQFCIGFCVFFPGYFTRPTGVLGAPQELQPTRRNLSPPLLLKI